jgi:hypothetical protein
MTPPTSSPATVPYRWNENATNHVCGETELLVAVFLGCRLATRNASFYLARGIFGVLLVTGQVGTAQVGPTVLYFYHTGSTTVSCYYYIV